MCKRGLCCRPVSACLCLCLYLINAVYLQLLLWWQSDWLTDFRSSFCGAGYYPRLGWVPRRFLKKTFAHCCSRIFYRPPMRFSKPSASEALNVFHWQARKIYTFRLSSHRWTSCEYDCTVWHATTCRASARYWPLFLAVLCYVQLTQTYCWYHGTARPALDFVPSVLLVRLPGMICRLICATWTLSLSDFRQLLKTALFQTVLV